MKFLTIILACLLALIALPALKAQEVTAGLSSPVTSVGQRVELVVTVRGVRSANVPEQIVVPGLQIQLFGRSTRFEMHNLSMTSSLTCTYAVMPTKAGEFEIPPIEVRVGDKTLKTNPLKLQVADAASMPLPPPTIPGTQVPSSGLPSGSGLPFFGDLVLSKKTAYVGEVVPAELRFYFKTNIGGEVGDRPNLAGEGFTVQRFAGMPKREQIVNGENYAVFAFQTALTAAKSGELTIPAAVLEARLQVPGSVPRGFEDFFRNFGGMVPPGMFTNAQNVNVETTPTSLKVSSLPSKERPEDFSGAIGKFEITCSVSPKKVAPGEPITLQVVVSGQGNFDAMGAPVLVDNEGWRTYPPTESFRASDAINFSGQKTYEYLLVATSDQSQTPKVEFSYFDPSSEQYVRLAQGPIAVDAPAATKSQSPLQAKPDPSPALVSPTPIDVKSIQKPQGATSWTPWLLQPWFLAANAVIAFIWGLLLVLGLLRRIGNSPKALKRKHRKNLEVQIADLNKLSDAEFLERASGILHSALDTIHSPLQAITLLSDYDQDTASTLRELLNRCDEAKYAPSSSARISPESRDRMVAALKKLLR